MKKPTLTEIAAHFMEVGVPESEAQCFLDYYESCGWKVGRNPMVSWKHAAGNWSRNYQKFNPKGIECRKGLSPIDRRILYDEFTRIERLIDNLRRADVVSQAEKQQLKDLRVRRSEIAAQLGIKF